MPSVDLWLDGDFARVRDACGAKPTEHVLRVLIGQQKLEHWRWAELVETFAISTGKNPPSCREKFVWNALGLHFVCEKIGHGQPQGMVFVGRVPQGKCYWHLTGEEAKRNQITSRILRLRGCTNRA
jgi:hypothetical protein